MRGILAATSLFALVLVGAFGVWSTYCMFFNMTTVCHIDAIEHIAYWQGLFLAILFIFSFVAIFVFFRPPHLEAEFLSGRTVSPGSNFDIFLANYLRRAFSQGILHPKIF